jgi:hypothetical protein
VTAVLVGSSQQLGPAEVALERRTLAEARWGQWPVVPAAELPRTGPRCQRWNHRRHSWRRTSEGGFDPARYHVAPVDEAAGKLFVCTQHYSRSWPAARLRYGLFEGPTLVGVAVLSIPVRAEVLTAVFPELIVYDESLELGRFVLLDRVPANGESWFLARVLRLAVAVGIRGLVAFSDPVPRRTSSGDLVLPGHLGRIYQASNATYLGRGRARRLRLLRDGRVLNDRAVAKILAGDRGHDYAERLLVEAGAPPRRAGQSAEAWLPVALTAAGVRLVAHPGNHKYALLAPTTRSQARALRAALPPASAYPKHLDHAPEAPWPLAA